MPAAPNVVADYERLVHQYRGELDEQRMKECLWEVERLVQLGRYTGPLGVFTATAIRAKEDAKGVEDIYVAFYPIHGGHEEVRMPVLNCLQFYTFLCIELI